MQESASSNATFSEIWTLTVRLFSGCYARDRWQADIEIDPDDTLNDLHDAIQHTVAFDDDHLYEFFVARTPGSRDRVRFDDENGGLSETIRNALPKEKDRKLYYFFDFGDSWVFSVSKSRRKPFPPQVDKTYPRMASERGTKPEQYPEWE